MPIYHIKDNTTGRVVKVQGNTPPDPSLYEGFFKQADSIGSTGQSQASPSGGILQDVGGAIGGSIGQIVGAPFGGVGAIGGGAIGGGLGQGVSEALSELFSGQGLDFKKIISQGGQGALYGAIPGAPEGKFLAKTALRAGTGALASGGSQLAQNIEQGKPILENVPQTATTGAVTSAVGGPLLEKGLQFMGKNVLIPALGTAGRNLPAIEKASGIALKGSKNTLVKKLGQAIDPISAKVEDTLRGAPLSVTPFNGITRKEIYQNIADQLSKKYTKEERKAILREINHTFDSIHKEHFKESLPFGMKTPVDVRAWDRLKTMLQGRIPDKAWENLNMDLKPLQRGAKVASGVIRQAITNKLESVSPGQGKAYNNLNQLLGQGKEISAGLMKEKSVFSRPNLERAGLSGIAPILFGLPLSSSLGPALTYLLASNPQVATQLSSLLRSKGANVLSQQVMNRAIPGIISSGSQ